jgi:putative transposase
VRRHMRLPAYCLMPNHFRVLLWPREDGDLSRFTSWLTMTHTQRWHAHHRTAGTGHLDQGRFKSFPVQSDEHFLTVCRYVERNALRANLVGRAEDWRWGRLGVPRTKDDADRRALTPWPIDGPRDWTDRVNRSFGPKAEEAVRGSIQRLGGVWRVIGGGPKEEEAVRRSIQRGQRTVRRAGRPRLRNDWGWSRCSAPEAVRERSLRTAPDLFSPARDHSRGGRRPCLWTSTALG